MNMKKFTFPGGIHPLPHLGSGKPLTDHGPLTRIPEPEELIFPLCAFIGAPAKPLVSVGDKVAIGQPLGEPGGFVSAYVNCSVSGTVTAIENHLLANGRTGLCVFVKNDFEGRVYEECKPMNWEEMDQAALREAVKRSGVVGMGGATFPTHVKLTPPADKPIDTALLNGAECECFLTCDQKLMETYPEDIVLGLRIIMKTVGATAGKIGVEDNKPEAIEALTKAAEGIEGVEVCPMVAKYPQGAEKHLIYSLTGRTVPCGGKLPSEVGVAVSNVGSAAALGRYFATGIPPRERILTVSGKGIKNPQNIIVPFGTPFQHCIDACGGISEDTAKVLAGGGMTGICVQDFSVPVVLGTSGITCLTESEMLAPPSNCIRCGRCVENCPLHLRPLLIANAVERNDPLALIRVHGGDCEECGICSYVCPANRPLIEVIRKGKGILREYNSKK